MVGPLFSATGECNSSRVRKVLWLNFETRDRMNKLAILALVLLFVWLGVRFALPPNRRK
jgi:hypothetical protein